LIRFAGHDEIILRGILVKNSENSIYKIKLIDKIYWMLSYVVLQLNINNNRATIVTLHKKMQQNLKTIGINLDRIKIIPNFVTQIFFDFHDCPTKYTFGYIGRLVYVKGVDLLLDAFNEFHNQHPNSTLLIIGEGNMQMCIERRIEQLNLKNSVFIMDPVDNDKVPYYLSQISIFVLPSRHEGLPNILLQAMASKLPIIATDVGGVSEVIENNYNGILIPSEDVNFIVKSMNYIYSNENIHRNLSQHAFNSANKYRLEAISNKYFSLINNTLC